MNKLFTKIAALALGAVMAVGVGVAVASSREATSVEAADSTLTISGSDFNTTSYAANNGGHTTGSIGWYSNQVMKNGNNMQWQKNNGYIYNTTDLGTIKSVTVNSSAGSFTTYYGTSEHPTSGTTVGGGFFTVKVGNATGTTSSIVVTYEPAAAKTLSSIALSGTYPTSFYAGDTFSHSGMIVTATYSDSTTADVTSSATFSGYNMSTTGNQTVTVSYTEGGTTKTATYGITINAARTMTGITLHGTIEKDNYSVGETWDLTGLDIQVNWSSGDPTYVDLDDESVAYECTPSTATSTSVTEFDIEVLYESFDETFTVDGLTVSVAPDILNRTFTSVTGTSYVAWSGKNGSSGTGAVYAGQSAGGNESIQLRNQNPSGVWTTSSGGVFDGIQVTWNSNTSDGRSITVYGKNSAYESGDLYDSNKRGTSIGTISKGQSTFPTNTNLGEFEYIGIAASGALYLTEIKIYWTTASTTPSALLDEDEVDLFTTSSSSVTAHVTIKNCEDAIIEWSENSDLIDLENDNEETVTIIPTALAEVEDVSVGLYVVGTDLEYSATLTVHLVEPSPGTQANPYDVAEAITAAGTGETGKYATGIVSKIVTEYSTQHSNITFDITDDGADSETVFLRVYRCGGTNANNVQVGDTVVVSGDLTTYKEIYEFAEGCQLQTLTKRVLSSISLSGDYPTEFNAGDSFSATGMTVTASFTGNSASDDVTAAATFSGYDMSNTGNQIVTVSVTDNGNTQTTTYGITVTAAVTKYTVSFNGNGAAGSMDSEQVNEGTSYQLPSNGFTVPSNKQFVGWKANDAGNVLAAGSSYTVNANVEFYAQWEDIPTATYMKVETSLHNYSGDYLIVCESENVAFDGSLTSLDVASNNVAATISSSKISLPESYEFHIASVTNGYSIQASSGKYIGQGSDTNGMQVVDSALTNTISYVNDSDNDMKIAGSGNAVLRYNSATNNERFRFFKTATYTAQKKTALYMQINDAAEEFALKLLNLTYGTCSTWTEGHDKSSSDFTSAWSTLSTLYDSFKSNVTLVNKLVNTVADENGTMMQEAMARYDLLVNKYHMDNIITSRSTNSAFYPINLFGTESNNATALIVIVSVMSITAVGAFYFMKKRKEN